MGYKEDESGERKEGGIKEPQQMDGEERMEGLDLMSFR